jgi:hypothetical protein
MSVRTGSEPPIGLALILLAAGALPGAAQQLPEPYTPSDRWSNYLHRTFAPARLEYLALETAIDQASSYPACRHRVAASYGRRYARAFQSRIVKNSAALATGLLTGEDLRYRPSQSPSFRGRLWNVLRSSVTARMPDGTTRLSYTRFVSDELALLSTVPWSRRPIRPEWFIQSVRYSILDQAQTNLLDEFGPDLRRVGAQIWKRVRRR